jgi:uncharacterized protein
MQIKKLFFKILIGIAVIYLLLGLYLYFNQNNIIYYPDNQNFDTCSGFSDYQKINYNGTRFYFKQNSAKVLVYYHGNGDSACEGSILKPLFEKNNYSVIFVEYAGYSGDDKKPSRELIFNDVKNVRKFISNKSFTNNIIVGRSIGTAAASYHASLGNADNLILISPFSTLADVAQSKYVIYPASAMLNEDYNNIESLKDFHGRLLILHGNKDLLISPKLSRELFDSVPSAQKEYALIPDKGHNDIMLSEQFIYNTTRFIDNS